MSIKHSEFDPAARRELEQRGLVVIEGLIHPGLAEAAVADTEGLSYFKKPRRILETNGQVATMRSSEPTNTALGAVLRHVGAIGHSLDLRLGLEADVQPAVQALELSSASHPPYTYNIGRTGVAAIMTLEGQAMLSSGLPEIGDPLLLEPGTVVVLRQREPATPYRLDRLSPQGVTSLLISGVEAHPNVQLAA